MDEALTQQLEQLEETLGELVAEHEQLLTLMQEKRRCLREADTDGMSEICRLENEKLQTISELEKQRLETIGHMTLQLDANAREPMRLRGLAEALPEPARGRLLARRQQLRERMEEVRRESSVARRAAQSLMGHVEGLVNTLSSVAAQGASYDRGGGPSGAAPAVRTLNLTA